MHERRVEVLCPCGLCETVSQPPARLLVCHCSQCPASARRDAYGGGVPWYAVPRAACEFATGALRERRESSWATRYRRARCGLVPRRASSKDDAGCSRCDYELGMKYDCEANTLWLHADAVAAQTEVDRAHIFCDAAVELASEVTRCSGFEHWLADVDPCRPANTPAPALCLACFQRSGSCTCKA